MNPGRWGVAGMFGCIADDVTGGTDLAGLLASNGCRVVQIIDPVTGSGLGERAGPEFDAIVISMKIRSIPREQAIRAALTACEALQSWGADRLYFKYCSTFDSTAHGNIGPIASALQCRSAASIVTFCPSFPANGRTLYQGHLFVGAQLVSNSSMRDHPLTPMLEPDLCKWLALQSPGKQVELVGHELVRGGAQKVSERLSELVRDGADFVLLDAISDADIETLAEACRTLPFNTGGSAFGAALAKRTHTAGDDLRGTLELPQMQSAAIISGSCSAASQEQVARAAAYLPTVTLDPAEIGPRGELPNEVLQEARQHISNAGLVLVTSTASAQSIATAQQGQDPVTLGERIETAMGQIAHALYDHGVRAFIVAGGETSGAVSKALSLDRLVVGPQIAPGVPWMSDARDSGIHIACKSGNFGGPDFFSEALDMIGMGRIAA